MKRRKPCDRAIRRGTLALAAAGLLLGAAPAWANGGVTEEATSLDAVPPAVADTLRAELGGRTAEEVERISYEGIVVLYEAEYSEAGEEREIYVYPGGELAARHEHDGSEEEAAGGY